MKFKQWYEGSKTYMSEDSKWRITKRHYCWEVYYRSDVCNEVYMGYFQTFKAAKAFVESKVA